VVQYLKEENTAWCSINVTFAKDTPGYRHATSHIEPHRRPLRKLSNKQIPRCDLVQFLRIRNKYIFETARPKIPGESSYSAIVGGPRARRRAVGTHSCSHKVEGQTQEPPALYALKVSCIWPSQLGVWANVVLTSSSRVAEFASDTAVLGVVDEAKILRAAP
jgi:hypothetical protein